MYPLTLVLPSLLNALDTSFLPSFCAVTLKKTNLDLVLNESQLRKLSNLTRPLAVSWQEIDPTR